MCFTCARTRTKTFRAVLLREVFSAVHLKSSHSGRSHKLALQKKHTHTRLVRDGERERERTSFGQNMTMNAAQFRHSDGFFYI